jgi:hypothetical protein
MTTPSESFPLALPESAQPVEVAANVAATGRLLGVLRTEVDHPQALIGKELEFADDGSFDLTGLPPLAETPDPDDMGSGYLAGIRPSDGAGQVVILQREKGGVVGRVIVTLHEGQPTRLFGERRVPWHPELGLTRREALKGQLATPELLDQLGIRLSGAFEAKRARMNDARQPRASLRAAARVALGPFLRRAPTDSSPKRRELE